MRRALALAALVALLTAASVSAAPDFGSLGFVPYEPPKAAPEFSLPDLEGTPRSLQGLRGKVVLLFFWATWWPDCRKELPSVNRLYQDLKGKGLEVVLIDFREKPDLVRRTASERGYVAPVLVDESGEVAGIKYGVWGPPTSYLVDREGRLLARGAGPRDWSSPAARKLLEDVLESLPRKR